MNKFDFGAAFAQHKENMDREFPSEKVFYDGDDDPIHQASAHFQREMEAELAAMTPAQREQAAREAQARLDEMRRHAA